MKNLKSNFLAQYLQLLVVGFFCLLLLPSTPLSAQMKFSKATRNKNASCPQGSFFDVIDGGTCWSCPKGYKRTIFSVKGNKACERPAKVVYKKAIDKGKAKWLKCPKGAFFDPNGRCYTCPSGYKRTVFSVKGGKACEKKIATALAKATKKASLACGEDAFYDPVDGGTCWSCPKGYKRTVFSVKSSKACETKLISCEGNVIALNSKQVNDMYAYQVHFDCKNETKPETKLLIGLGINVDKSYYYTTSKPDGCSIPDLPGGKKIIAKDKKRWEAACNIHDWMYSTLAPEGKEKEWKKYADKALKINAAAICQEVWPNNIIKQGGCFDGARNMYNWLRNGEASPIDAFNTTRSFESGQQRAEDNEIQLSLTDYNTIVDYIKQNDVPDIGILWRPSKGVLVE